MKIYIRLCLALSFLLSYSLYAAQSTATAGDETERGRLISASSSGSASGSGMVHPEATCFRRFVQASQNFCYQVMARTCWDSIMAGFKPGRVIAINALDIQPAHKVLFVGEGSGLDFEVLPDSLNKRNLKALDFSPEMIRQAKQKALLLGIPEENCFVGDAQHLPFTEEKFDGIYFPLSLGSIPNPALALREAERVLNPKGKIVVMEKLVDDGHSPSYMRQVLNFFTQFFFADINRNLTQMLGTGSSLKIIDYHSLEDRLTGLLGRAVGPYYRVATIVRNSDYPELPMHGATLDRRDRTD